MSTLTGVPPRTDLASTPQQNPLRIKRIHHLEFWVGNAKQAAHFYRTAFGFNVAAYSGLETGNRETTSYLLSQGDVRLLLTTPMRDGGAINAHIARHGDGVRDIALEVEDADHAFAEATSRGAVAVSDPASLKSDDGELRVAAIQTYGDTIHSFISRAGYGGPFMPGFMERVVPGVELGFIRVDHMVGNVELGKMNHWAQWYSDVMGFHRYITFDDKDISTEYSALMSIVMSDDNYVIKMPINEPAEGKKKSQIQEYLDFYNGPGCQHIALLTGDIIKTVGEMRSRGVEFLTVPPSYYDEVPGRVGPIQEDLAVLAELGILIDRDEHGYLLQLFTKPVEDRPTLFFEIIQRHGCRGFGKGNFKALFESIEREQERRGNL
jgi:4-hydroxyphenylpyruvate dioxygenase